MFDIAWYYQGMENYKYTVIKNIYVKITGLCCIFIFVRNEKDLGKYIFCLSAITLIANLSLWRGVLNKIQGYRKIKLECKRHIKAILALYIPQIIIQLYTVFDKTMLGFIGRSPAENGYYEQAEKIARLAASVVTTFSTVMMPRISSLYSLRKKEQAYTEIKTSFRFVWFLGIPIMFGLIGIRKEFVSVFLGNGYEKVVDTLSIISIIVILVGLNNVTGLQYFIPMGEQRKLTISVSAGAFVDIVMNLILIPRLQSVGAAISIIMAETIITIIQLYYMSRNISVKRVFSCGWKYILSGTIMFIVITKIQFSLNSVLVLIIKVITGIVVYFAALIILKDKMILDELKKMNNIQKGR